VVLKPRFGSWGRDVVLCPTADALDRELARFSQRPWFAGQGVLAQELVPPLGWDLRVVVSGGRVVGAARRVAAPGEWRTNVALGGHIERAVAPPLAQALALEAAAAIRGDLLGIDLLPLGESFVVSEVNGAVDFRRAYAPGPGNVFRDAVHELVRVAQLRRAAA
jgi:glutathione synthase/RimK-type ligase-like ATP-grasp enzyme